ncbi:CidA/LrgA family protein [Chloroflexia bacterium SDU3-3]|nr:CidA/LrgA family protein [Chloroflexia bacterium SDU3-3]
MLKSITALLIFQLLGEVISRTLGLPIPGPVIGMLLLVAALFVRGSAPASLTRAAGGLIQNLSLLYVPVGVGIMVQFGLLQREWLAILLTLVVSTVVTIVITALSMRFLMRWLTPGALGEEA